MPAAAPDPRACPVLPCSARRSSRLDFSKLYSNSSAATVDLLSRMLVFNPNDRITVDEVRGGRSRKCPGGAARGRDGERGRAEGRIWRFS